VLGRGPLAQPPRIWLVTRNSDVSADMLARVESSMSAADYQSVGGHAEFTNVTVRLYRLATYRAARMPQATSASLSHAV